MTLTMNDNFAALTNEELQVVDGGGWSEFAGVLVGTLAIGLSPAVGAFCPPVGIGMALGGAGIIGKATGAY